VPAIPRSFTARRAARAAAALLALGAAACWPETLTAPTASKPGAAPDATIIDGAHAGAATSSHFFFLAPTVLSTTGAPGFSGTFDPTLRPVARVCAGTGPCPTGSAIAVFTSTGGTGGGALAALRVNPALERYSAVWDTRECVAGRCDLTPGAPYRVHVYATNARGAEVELGAADIDVVKPGAILKPGPLTDYAQYSPLVAKLPWVLAFRIEPGVVGEVVVGPATSPFKVGETQTLTATVRDLQGATLPARPVSWRSADEGIVTVSPAGLITATGAGSATVIATSDLQVGTATVTVIPTSLNVWTSRASMLAPRYGFATGVVNGVLYAAGGSNNAATLASVEAYDAAANTWTARAPMSVPRYAPASGTIDGIVYVAGGFNAGTVFSSVEAYDPATNTWSARAPMPTPRYGATAGVVGGILYVIGGFGNGVYQTTVEAYDPATNTWSTRAPLSTARYTASAGVVGGRLYVAGGSGAAATVGTSVEVYDPATNAWSSRASLLASRANAAAGVVDGVLYLIGGFSNGAFVATVDAYDPATDTWTSRAPMSALRYFGSAGTIGGRVYVAGGEDRFNVLSSTEAYTP
jgi:N-acetylneuraminic acid mutarotase